MPNTDKAREAAETYSRKRFPGSKGVSIRHRIDTFLEGVKWARENDEGVKGLVETLEQAIKQLHLDYIHTPLDGRRALIDKLKNNLQTFRRSLG